jgi:AcrR family transcriptional regulator
LISRGRSPGGGTRQRFGPGVEAARSLGAAMRHRPAAAIRFALSNHDSIGYPGICSRQLRKGQGPLMVQVKKAEVRDSIVDAAFQLFRMKGYLGASITDIGQAAGVAPSGIYVYFKSKLELFYAVYRPWLKERLLRLERELVVISGYRAKIRRIVEVIWLDIPNEANFFANNLMQAVSTAAKNDFYSGELLEWCEQRLARMLRSAAPRSRQNRDDYRQLAHILFMAFNGFVVRSYLGVRAEKMTATIDTMTDLIAAAAPARF